MISLIICSTQNTLNSKLKENIHNTIGTEYEIIHIDNSTNRYNIFQAYNEGVRLAKGDILCFMHEDIMYHSNNWGKITEQYLANKYIGALGVAGGHYVATKTDWRFYGFGIVHLIQGTRTIEESPQYYKIYTPIQEYSTQLINVSVLDGVWFCIRRELFDQIRFDDINFRDFHLYDSDICMQINKIGKGVFVTRDILLEHFSEGTFTIGYKESLNTFMHKWKEHLPMLKGIILKQEEIDKAIAQAEKRFSERLEKDAKIINLRKKFNLHKKGEDVTYSNEEIEFLDHEAFNFIRMLIHDKKRKNDEVWTAVCNYRSSFFALRKNSILYKYIWHRLLKL